MPVYFCADLHIANGIGNRYFSLVIQNCALPTRSIWNRSSAVLLGVAPMTHLCALPRECSGCATTGVGIVRRALLSIVLSHQTP